MQNLQLFLKLTAATREHNGNCKLLYRLSRQLSSQVPPTTQVKLAAATSGLRPVACSTRKQSTTGPSLGASRGPSLMRKDREQEEDDELELSGQSNFQLEDAQPISSEEQLEVHRFVSRHIGPRDSDLQEMLELIGYKSMDELIEATIPEQIRLNRSLNLPGPVGESELLKQLRSMAEENSSGWRSFIGLGYHDCHTPAVIMRNLFENPGWTTAYTAYQAEIAQGRLESLMNYQTLVRDLTGLDVANASLLDESTAAAEAMQVCLRHHRGSRQRWLLSSRCHPQTKAVVETRARALGVRVDYFDELERDPLARYQLKEYSGLLVQYPNTTGHLFELDELTSACQAAGCLVAVATDLLACSLFRPPGDFKHRADLAVGSSQRLGVPLNFGGPHAGFLACDQRLVRSIPGRVVGVTRDSSGQPAYRFALQTREQHIRRDKATSNICTAQALLANMSAMYAVYHGPEGLKEIAHSIHAKTSLLAETIGRQSAAGSVELLNEGNFFDTLTLRVADQAQVKRRALEQKINLRYEGNDLVSISLDETTKLSDVYRLANLFASGELNLNPNYRISSMESARNMNNLLQNKQNSMPLDGKLRHLRRESQFLQHPTFNSHTSEAQLVRYMKSLENKDISLVHSMIPLGSCTMKLNATSQMLASSWPQFANCHPFQPSDQCKGYLRLFEELNEYLCEITGYDRISFQPNSGAQGEYAGLRCIKSYLESVGQSQRDVCLIPISAHGTNPASAQMAGFRCQTIRVLDNGNMDMEDLRAKLDKFRDRVACLMITYPSTYGVFEDNVRQVCELVHEAGGQVYLDGANMNAQVGLCRPGDYGSDVSHLNLHKTFCIPHGGGGPGAGPIGVKRHLAPFLPAHPLVPEPAAADRQPFGTVSASMWGSPAILPISWSYIRLMGSQLRKSSEAAILNANYMRKKLEGHYKILFRGSLGNVAHEFIIDCRPFKRSAQVEAADIAKRLQDFGLHAPTVSWPVSNTLMLEPTESEDKRELDRYCEALIAIRGEIAAIEAGEMSAENNPIRNAPHTQRVVCATEWDRPYSREQAAFPAPFVRPDNKIWPTVGRVDDTYGDTNLFCSCPPPQAADIQ